MTPLSRLARMFCPFALVLGLAAAPALAQTAEQIAAVQAWLN